MGVGEVREGGEAGLGAAEHGRDPGEPRREQVGDGVDLLAHERGGGLREDRADVGGDHGRGVLGHSDSDVALEVDAVALPRRVDQCLEGELEQLTHHPGGVGMPEQLEQAD